MTPIIAHAAERIRNSAARLPMTRIQKISYLSRRLWNSLATAPFKLKLIRLLHTDLLIKQETGKLLAKQFVDNHFNRLDVIVRYLAIEEWAGKNDFGFALYNKMQGERQAPGGSEDRFRTLIKSVADNGYDCHSRICVDLDQRLMGGSHRLALALYFNVPDISIEIAADSSKVQYGAEWFRRHNFTDKEMENIENKRRRVFRDYGIHFSITLWPPVEKYYREIEARLSEEYSVVSSDCYELGERFEEIVRRIYDVDDIEDWKIFKKIEAMSGRPKRIRHICLEIPHPKFRKKGLNNNDISTVAEAIKRRYRAIYAKKVDNYFMDIIIHIGDNYRHNSHILKILDEIEHLKC